VVDTLFLDGSRRTFPKKKKHGSRRRLERATAWVTADRGIHALPERRKVTVAVGVGFDAAAALPLCSSGY
jgi:hypothetical protein